MTSSPSGERTLAIGGGGMRSAFPPYACFFDLLQDLPPQPRHEQLHDLPVRRGQPAGFGRRAASPALCSTSFIMSNSVLVAHRSALADLSTICVTIASCLVT